MRSHRDEQNRARQLASATWLSICCLLLSACGGGPFGTWGNFALRVSEDTVLAFTTGGHFPRGGLIQMSSASVVEERNNSWRQIKELGQTNLSLAPFSESGFVYPGRTHIKAVGKDRVIKHKIGTQSYNSFTYVSDDQKSAFSAFYGGGLGAVEGEYPVFQSDLATGETKLVSDDGYIYASGVCANRFFSVTDDEVNGSGEELYSVNYQKEAGVETSVIRHISPKTYDDFELYVTDAFNVPCVESTAYLLMGAREKATGAVKFLVLVAISFDTGKVTTTRLDAETPPSQDGVSSSPEPYHVAGGYFYWLSEKRYIDRVKLDGTDYSRQQFLTGLSTRSSYQPRFYNGDVYVLEVGRTEKVNKGYLHRYQHISGMRTGGGFQQVYRREIPGLAPLTGEDAPAYIAEYLPMNDALGDSWRSS